MGQDFKGAAPFGDSSSSSCACYSQKQRKGRWICQADVNYWVLCSLSQQELDGLML